MRRIMLVVAYDGTDYCGWQTQPNALAVEAVINRELSRLLQEEIHVIGASRTDAGVHALGNVAVFDTNARIPGDKVSYALNQSLPPDIRIQNSREVAADFHPRHCASRKTYEYSVYQHRFENPLCRRYMYFFHHPLDVEKMRKAAGELVGTHDFKSFCNIHTQVESTVRTIYVCEVSQDGCVITIHIEGNGFLYNMVRIIAGTLIEIGSGMRDEDSICEILRQRNREAAGKTAPAHGLRLIGMEFLDSTSN